MPKDDQHFNLEYDSLVIINTLKLLNSSQKKSILNRIDMLKAFDDKTINTSSEAYPKEWGDEPEKYQ